MDSLSMCADVHRCLTTQEEQELIQITALVQDKQDLSATYLSIHSRSLVDSIVFYIPRGHIQLLLTLVWGTQVIAKVRIIHAAITECINPPALIDVIITTTMVSDGAGNTEWHAICKEYEKTYKEQLPATLHIALSKQSSLWAKICEIWIETHKVMSANPDADASKLAAALRNKDVDTIAFIIGMADPSTWGLIVEAFEQREHMPLMDAFEQHLKRHDRVSCQLACQMLLGLENTAAFLLHRAVADYGDHDRLVRTTALFHSRIKNIDIHYKKYGDIRSDMKRVFQEQVAHACTALWGLL